MQQRLLFSGFDEEGRLRFLIDGGVDATQDGDTWLIEKGSLLEYREAPARVLHWND